MPLNPDGIQLLSEPDRNFFKLLPLIAKNLPPATFLFRIRPLGLPFPQISLRILSKGENTLCLAPCAIEPQRGPTPVGARPQLV